MRPDEQLSALQALDRKAPEQVANLRKVTAGWPPDDARWDALVAALDWACQDHAHQLAEKQRAGADQSAMMRSERMQGIAQGLRLGADMIDSEVSNSGS